MIWVINWEYKWVLRLFGLFKSYKILHVECDIWPVDSAKSCSRASNMATGLYAVSYTITHGSSVLHSKVQTVDAEWETFNSLFKSSKSVDGYRIVDVCVAACSNGPWASINAAEGLHVCRDIGYRHIHFKVEKLAEEAPEEVATVPSVTEVLMANARKLTLPKAPELLSMFS